MCKCNKLDSNMSKRTTRYLKRTIKKNNQEILNDKKHIKLLNESLKYMTDYAISSYNYNNYLVNMITNFIENDKTKQINTPTTTTTTTEESNEQNNTVEQSNTQVYTPNVTITNNLCKEDICTYI